MDTNSKNTKNCQPKHICVVCNYYTCKTSEYNRHLLTSKHIRLTNTKEKILEIPVKYRCNCGNTYKHLPSLCKHKKTCSKLQTLTDEENIKKLNESGIPPDDDGENIEETKKESNTTLLTSICDKDIIIMLVKQNSELIKELSGFKNLMAEQSAAMLEIAKNSGNNSHNNTNTNSNNSFNLQFFLNETCKNAMNMSEFIEGLKVEIEDLEYLGKCGYIEGISNVITKHINKLEINERPIHCTDQKRGTLYIKDNDIWEKDDEKQTSVRKIIKRVSQMNFKNMYKYREKYKGCEESDSRYSNSYNKVTTEAWGGKDDDDVEKQDKIIHNIIKCVGIEKIKNG